VNAFKLHCPYCGFLKPIIFRQKTHTLILSCDHCHNLMFFRDGQCLRMDKVLLSEVKNPDKITELMDIFVQREPRPRKRISPFRPRHLHPVEPTGTTRRPKPSIRNDERQNPITKSDVIDLIIDLHLSKSVSDFLRRLE